MLMGAHDRGIDKEVVCEGARPRLEALPEPAPDAAPFPAAKAVVHRVPVPKVLWEIAPWGSRPGEIQDRLDKVPVAERRRAAGARFERGEDGGEFRPRLVREQQTYRHYSSSKSALLEET